MKSSNESAGGAKKRLVIAVCGASGSVYGIRFAGALVRTPVEIFLVISSAGRKVLAHETGYQGEGFENFLKKEGFEFHPKAMIREYDRRDLFAPIASGSFMHHGMVVVPCSMNTLGALASGITDDLVKRAADVTLKEKRPLILVTRETPLNAVHLENMHRLTLAGATILPACPGFYHRPKSIPELVDTIVARILDHLNFPQDLVKPWGRDEEKD